MTKNKHIDIELLNGVMRIGINRPDKKNALTENMYDAMRLALENARENQDIKSVLFHGIRDVFSAGNDLEEFNHRAPDVPSPGAQFLMVLQSFEKPVVAAVSGLAIGIGVTLLLHCDLVFAASDTRFRTPFVNLGICPEAGSTLLLPANAGYKMAAEILMLGAFFGTQKAIKLGIVNKTASNVLNYAVKKAEDLAQKPQQALLLTKKLLKQATQNEVLERMAEECKHFDRLLCTPESIEVRAKLQKNV